MANSSNTAVAPEKVIIVFNQFQQNVYHLFSNQLNVYV